MSPPAFLRKHRFPGTGEGEVFVNSAVPAYIAEINDVLDDKGQQLTLVPEPASAVPLLAGAGFCAGRHRRKS